VRAGSTPEGPASNLKERENYPVVQVAWGRRGRLCEVGVGVWLDGFMRGDDATRRMGVQKVKEMIEELCRECSKRNGEMSDGFNGRKGEAFGSASRRWSSLEAEDPKKESACRKILVGLNSATAQPFSDLLRYQKL
jgi:hypothetical protein